MDFGLDFGTTQSSVAVEDAVLRVLRELMTGYLHLHFMLGMAQEQYLCIFRMDPFSDRQLSDRQCGYDSAHRDPITRFPFLPP